MLYFTSFIVSKDEGSFLQKIENAAQEENGFSFEDCYKENQESPTHYAVCFQSEIETEVVIDDILFSRTKLDAEDASKNWAKDFPEETIAITPVSVIKLFIGIV